MELVPRSHCAPTGNFKSGPHKWLMPSLRRESMSCWCNGLLSVHAPMFHSVAGRCSGTTNSRGLGCTNVEYESHTCSAPGTIPRALGLPDTLLLCRCSTRQRRSHRDWHDTRVCRRASRRADTPLRGPSNAPACRTAQPLVGTACWRWPAPAQKTVLEKRRHDAAKSRTHPNIARTLGRLAVASLFDIYHRLQCTTNRFAISLPQTLAARRHTVPSGSGAAAGHALPILRALSAIHTTG